MEQKNEQPKKKRITKKLLYAIYAMNNAGYTSAQIAEALGISETEVVKRVHYPRY